jgi:cAMP-dependent protein kinase regulator
MSQSSSLLSTLQSTIDQISKVREESHHGNSLSTFSYRSSDLNDRVGNLERSISHIISRLDRIEDATRRSERGSSSSVDDVLSSTERILREALIELLKQQNLIMQYRQENESLRAQLGQKKESATSGQQIQKTSSSHAPQHAPQHVQPHAPQHAPQQSRVAFAQPVAQPAAAAKPPIQPAKKAVAVTKPAQPKHDDGNDETDAEPVQHRLPVEFPPGYRHRGRRFSVAGESYNPTTDLQNIQRNIIQKSNEARNRIRTVICNNILFKNLDEEQLEDLIDEMFEVRLKPDGVIIRQGDDGDNFYVVDSGELYVLYKDVVVATIGVGKGFGEIALMYMCPRTATVKAKTDVILWGMSRATFRRSLMTHAIRKRELYESFLERVPLLESLLPYERSIIADALESRTYKDGELIIREGEKGDAFYIIEKGRVVVTKGNPPVEVKSCSEGDYFGELALLTDQPRAANVRAIGQVRVLYLRREDFSALMGPCEEILKRNTQIYNQINASLNNSMQPARPKYQNVSALVADFVQDENNYLNNLSTVLKEFLRPMRKAAESKSLPISDEEVNHLFPQVEMINNVHTMLAEALPELSNPALFGKIFAKAAPGLRFHSDFNRGWDEALKILDKYKGDPAMQQFFKAPNRAQHDLLSLLTASHERLAKTLSYLREYITFAPNDKDALAAIEKLEAL